MISCRDLRVQLLQNCREGRAVLRIQNHARSDIRAKHARGSQCVETADVGAHQQHAPVEAHRVVQLLQADEAHVEAPHAVTEKIHAVEGHAGKCMNMPGDLEPGRESTEHRAR